MRFSSFGARQDLRIQGRCKMRDAEAEVYGYVAPVAEEKPGAQ
jgi:hypothetical protein